VVTTTDDPDVAYRIATKNQPDVLLLDVQLKDGNGIELCRKLRQNQLTRKIPIVMMTGVGTHERMLSSYEGGAINQLSETEFDLLRIFLTNPNQKISRQSGDSEDRMERRPSQRTCGGRTHQYAQAQAQGLQSQHPVALRLWLHPAADR
jgi:DNA-binding response OmpR family regulator